MRYRHNATSRAAIAPKRGVLAPANSVLPSIIGNAVVGQKLTGVRGSWSGAPTSYTQQWYRDGTLIGGATQLDYILVAADEGTDITFKVVATNAVGSSAAIESAAVGPIDPEPVAAPAFITAPTITGTLIAGQTLTGSNGTWTGLDATITARQWKSNGVNIGGATNATFLLTSSEVGDTITFSVTVTNDGGSDTEISAGVGPIEPAPGDLAISGTPDLTVERGSFYSFTPAAEGGTPPYTFSITGSLPTGLSFNSSTGRISGTVA